MRPPTVLTKCVANHYANKGRQRIVEVLDRETGKGCLISVSRMDNGELQINVYRMDPGILVTASDDRGTICRGRIRES